MARKPKRQLLSNEARDAIVAELESLSLQLADMDRAESCGVDCQAYRALAQYVHAQLSTIKAVAFDGVAPTPEMMAAAKAAVQPPMPLG